MTSETVEQSDAAIRLTTKVNDWGLTGGEVLGPGQGCEPAQQTSPLINFEALSVICIPSLHGMF